MTDWRRAVYSWEQNVKNLRSAYNHYAPAAAAGWFRYNWWAYSLLLAVVAGDATWWVTVQQPAGPVLIGGIIILVAGYITCCVNSHWIEAREEIDSLATRIAEAEAQLDRVRASAEWADAEAAVRRAEADEVAADLVALAASSWPAEKTEKLARVLGTIVERTS